MSNSNTAPTRHPVFPLVLLAMGTFAMGTDSFVISGILPQIASGFRTTPGAAGQAVTVFALAYAVAGPVMAIASGRVARRRLLLAALALFTLANLGSVFAPNFAVFLLTRVVAAIGAATFTPTASAAAAALAGPDHRGRAIAVIFGGLTVGTIFGVPLGTSLGQAWGWQASIVFVAAVGALSGLALLLTLPRLPQPASVPLRRRLAIMVEPRILLIVSVNGLATMAGITVYTYLAELAASHGLIGGGLTLVLFVAGVGGTIGVFCSGWLTDRIGPDRTLLLGLLLLAAALVALGLAGSAWLVLGLVGVFSMAGWSPTTPNNTRLAGLVPDFPNVAMSLNSSAAYFGQALGAVLGGVLLQAGAAPPALCFAGAAIALVAIAAQELTIREPRPVGPASVAQPGREA